MITLIDIQKAIEKKIKDALIGTEFSTIKPLAEDITDSFPRPSLKVRLENPTNGKYNSLCKERSVTVRIYFFAPDRNKYSIPNLKMQQIIEDTFIDGLQVNKSFFIDIENVESEVVDGVLICSFDLYYIEELPNTDTSEIMESLNLKL